MSKVMTILEAHVAPEKAAALEHAYAEMTGSAELRGSEPVQSFLIHSTSDATLWRILSVWSSREALDKMRSTTAVPAGVLMYRAAGAEPALTVFQVANGFGGQ
jgi:quinol monooxygenase YgiN